MLPPPKIFSYILGLVVGFFILEYFFGLLPDYRAYNWFDVVFWAGLVFIAKRTEVRLPFSSSISHIFVVALAAAVLFPTWLAPLLIFLFSIDKDSGKPHYPWFKDLFNRTQNGVATGLAGLVWWFTQNYLDSPVLIKQSTGIVLASLILFISNMAMVNYVIHLATGTSIRKIWFENFSWLWKSYLILAPVGLLLARAYEVPLVGGWGGFTVLFIMLLLYFSRFYWDEKVKLEEAFDTTIEVLVSAIDAKDPHTRMHSERVAAITADLAKAMGLDEPDQKKITYAARIHDVGKVGIPDSVLFKPTKLTTEEFDLIKSHPTRGTELLSPMRPYLAKEVMQVILHHHERWDGTGYPTRKKGEEIPLWARIVSLSDAYEAMTAGRAYTRAKSPEEALNEIITFSGRQFDPQVVQAFEQLWLGEPIWKDREVFLRHSSSPVPFLDLPSPSSPEPAPATSPTSS